MRSENSVRPARILERTRPGSPLRYIVRIEHFTNQDGELLWDWGIYKAKGGECVTLSVNVKSSCAAALKEARQVLAAISGFAIQLEVQR